MSQAQEWVIQKYVTEKGVCPFDAWFKTLDPQAQARIDVRLDRVSLGNFGDHKSVGEGVFELRFTFGPGLRVYYGLAGKRVVLLLIGGSKKGQSHDISVAQKFWQAFHSEQQGGA
jgi:putative addiction module killer protein